MISIVYNLISMCPVLQFGPRASGGGPYARGGPLQLKRLPGRARQVRWCRGTLPLSHHIVYVWSYRICCV